MSVNFNKINETDSYVSVFFLSVLCVLLTFIGGNGVLFVPCSCAQEAEISLIPELAADTFISADRLFPDSAKGFVAIRDVKSLVEQWKKTQVGLLTQDPIMKPFIDDFRSQVDKRMENQLGLNLDGIDNCRVEKSRSEWLPFQIRFRVT